VVAHLLHLGKQWLERKTVLPLAPNVRTSSLISRMPAGSRPLLGSSRMRSLGSLSSAAAMPRRCRIPSEYPLTLSRARSLNPTRSRTSSTDGCPVLRSLRAAAG